MSVKYSLAEQINGAIRRAIGPGPAVLHEPSFQGNEWIYVKECLDSTFVSSVGEFVDRFEADIAAFTGAKHAVAVVNGTAALHIALMLAGVCADDEVLVPTLTFVATANAVTYCGAIPHFIDSEARTLGVDIAKLREYLIDRTDMRDNQCVNRETRRIIRAIVPMHTFGHPIDIDELLKLADDFKIAIVEDAAESLGSFYHGQHTGTFGLLGVLSFNGNKTITTGGGGAILTNDSELAKRAKHLTTTAKVPHAWEYCHDEIGFNYRMPNLNAALGCAQLEQLPQLLEAKRELYRRYDMAFQSVRGAALMTEPEGCRSNYWLHTIVLDSEFTNQRDQVLCLTNEAGFMTRPAWTLMTELIPFAGCPRMDVVGAISLSSRIINIPSSSGLVGRNS
jgi:aminotransferase in exopolysaccharide biosynthesis